MMKRISTFNVIVLFFCFIFFSLVAIAQEPLNLLMKLDKGLPLSGLNGSGMGEVVACIGDVNHDGYDDWAVGFPYASDYETGATVGKVYVYFGNSSIHNNEVPDIILEGNSSIGYFAEKIVAVGDVNHDGFSDFMVSDYRQVELFFGGNPMDNEPDLILPIDNYLESASSAGDINADGINDFIISSGNSVSIYFGASNVDSQADILLHGFYENDGFGTSVSNIGDINKDGFDDIIVGADGDYFNKTDPGKAYIYFGGTDMDTIPDIILSGENTGDRFGNMVSGAGDINHDGFLDWAVSAYSYENEAGNTGKVYIYFGGQQNDVIPDLMKEGKEVYPVGDIDKNGLDDLIVGRSVFLSEQSKENNPVYTFPEYTRIAGRGDLNGDGFADIVVGQPSDDVNGYDSGSVSVYFGGTSLAWNPGAVFYGAESYEHFGSCVAGVGDINNDGFSDFIVGAYGNGKHGILSGAAYLYLGGDPVGKIPAMKFYGQKADDYFGYSASSAGDVNGDGVPDFIIGGFSMEYANLYLGGMSLDSIPDYIFKGKKVSNHFGNDVSSAGDFNHDGYDDILIGEFCNSEKDLQVGRAYLYFGGPDLDTIPDLTFEGEEVFNNFGTKVTCAGDVNGDGFPDIMIGAPGWDRNNNLGRIYIYYGGPTPDTIPDLVITGTMRYRRLGDVISSAGDVNNDGFDDIIVGLPFLGNAIDTSYVYIYFGGNQMDTIPDIEFKQVAYSFGSGVGRAGNLNNDGFDDVIIGGYDQIQIYFGGKKMDTIPDMVIEGEMFGAFDFGSNVSCIGDINRDGYSDILIGYPYSNAVGHMMGRAYIYSNPIKTSAKEIVSEKYSVQIYPNPFSSETTIRYKLKGKSNVKVNIYNALGRKVETLLNETQLNGEHQINWRPKSLSFGLYFCKIQTPGFSETKKMIYKE